MIPTFGDSANGSSEKSLNLLNVIPSSLPDPGGTSGAGGYPKLASMDLLYCKVKVIEVWASLEVYTLAVDAFAVFIYAQTTTTAKHIETDGIDKMQIQIS